MRTTNYTIFFGCYLLLKNHSNSFYSWNHWGNICVISIFGIINICLFYRWFVGLGRLRGSLDSVCSSGSGQCMMDRWIKQFGIVNSINTRWKRTVILLLPQLPSWLSHCSNHSTCLCGTTGTSSAHYFEPFY